MVTNFCQKRSCFKLKEFDKKAWRKIETASDSCSDWMQHWDLVSCFHLKIYFHIFSTAFNFYSRKKFKKNEKQKKKHIYRHSTADYRQPRRQYLKHKEGYYLIRSYHRFHSLILKHIRTILILYQWLYFFFFFVDHQPTVDHIFQDMHHLLRLLE